MTLALSSMNKLTMTFFGKIECYRLLKTSFKSVNFWEDKNSRINWVRVRLIALLLSQMDACNEGEIERFGIDDKH